MTLRFRATAEAEAPSIRELLLTNFPASDNAPAFSLAHLAWKYFSPHPSWKTSRSFVYESDGSLIAHACAWPFTLRRSGTSIEGVHPIDWVANATVPGGGALLLRNVRALREISICVGGTDVARTVIAKSGFRPHGEVHTYARPLRPLRQAFTHQHRNWKLPARFIRNSWWARTRADDRDREWSAQRVEPEQVPEEVLPDPAQNMSAAERSPGIFRYFLQCPITRYQLYVVSQRSRAVGYFMLSFVPGQARVADAWSVPATTESWKALYALAVSAALDEGSASELSAATSLTGASAALEGCGFRRFDSVPIMVFDPGKRLAGIEAIHFQMIDNDFSFLHSGEPRYLT